MCFETISPCNCVCIVSVNRAWCYVRKTYRAIKYVCMDVHASLAGQPEFESKDCHPRMKIRMISIIVSDNCLCRNGSHKLYRVRLPTMWECTVHFVFCDYVTLTWVSVPPGRNELSIGSWYFCCEGPSAFYRESQLNEGIAANGFDPKAGTSSRNGTQFCSVSAGRVVLFEIQQALGR